MGGFITCEQNAMAAIVVDPDMANRLASESIYSDLKPGFIRTVTILPSEFRFDPVEYILTEAPLANPLVYNALSYTWGSKSNPCAIAINNISFLVTRNLLIALIHLRALGFNGPLWIDAICKNIVPKMVNIICAKCD